MERHITLINIGTVQKKNRTNQKIRQNAQAHVDFATVPDSISKPTIPIIQAVMMPHYGVIYARQKSFRTITTNVQVAMVQETGKWNYYIRRI
jgi:hypothetical protein